MKGRSAASAVLFVLLALTCAADDFHPPGGETYARSNAAVTILPGGRALKPMGSQIELGPGAFGMAVSPKGLIGVAETGFERFGVSVLEPHKDQWNQRMLWAVPTDDLDPQSRAAKQPDRWQSVTSGIAFESERSVWVSEGDTGKIRLLEVSTGGRRELIDLNTGDYRNSYTANLAIDPVRHILYALDQANDRVVLINTEKDTVVSSVATGHMPFTLALSPDRNTVYVANIGLNRYQVLPTPLPFPPAIAPADPNADSICVIDVRDVKKPAVTTWIHTGSGPDGILAVGEKVYVSNSHSDSITVISVPDYKVLGQIIIRVPWLLPLRGFLPAGMAYDPVTKRLFVAEAGINAVGVIDTNRNVVIGHLPVGLYPTSVAIADGRVWVVNTRGRGTGANGSRPLQSPDEQKMYYRGSLTTFTMPAADDLQKLTATTFAANGFFVEKTIPAPLPAAIKHVVLIVKQNRAFDEILGDVGDASNGKVQATAAMARYGLHGRANGGGTRFSVKDAAITPNTHAIAKQFAFSDNFYADGDTDVDGHHWLTGITPDLFTMSGQFASYGGQRHFILDNNSPGRLLFAGTNAATLPLEIPENGTLWDHLQRNHITFRSFGEGLDVPGYIDGKYATNIPIEESLADNASHEYPGHSLDIPDQVRADKFIAELDERYKSEKEPLPQFLFVSLPNDETGDERPNGGYPYASSWVADNDLALGRILDYLSHSPWWRETAVFVTEDTAAGGIDLVDAHRTILLAAGPYARRDYVSHTNTSFPGLLKTIFRIFRIPALNLMDQTAAGLGDMFTDDPDYTPYTVVASDKRIFDPAQLPK